MTIGTIHGPEWYDDDRDDEEGAWNIENACIDCGEQGVGEVCGQCGMPLCVQHAETGAGFCSRHPDKNFKGF